MVECINGLTDLVHDTEKVQHLLEQSPDGNIWAYTDAGLFFPDDWMAKAVDTFNQGQQDVFHGDDIPAHLSFYKAGPTYDSVNTGGAKSGGRIVEFDPEQQKIVTVSRSGVRQLLYTAAEYKRCT